MGGTGYGVDLAAYLGIRAFREGRNGSWISLDPSDEHGMDEI